MILLRIDNEIFLPGISGGWEHPFHRSCKMAQGIRKIKQIKKVKKWERNDLNIAPNRRNI